MPLFGGKKTSRVAPIASAKGLDGEFQLYEQTLRIRSKNEEKDILLATISSTQLKRAGWIFPGHLEVTFSGGQEGGALATENQVLFKRRQRKSFERFKAELDQRVLATRSTRLSPPEVTR